VLVLRYRTDNNWIRFVALLVAVLILRTAIITFKKSFSGIMDTALPKEEVDTIKSVLVEHKQQIVDFHAMRTRKSGNQRFADLHLVMHRTISVEEAHDMTDHLEDDLKEKLPNLSITIHVEPCDSDCKWCLDKTQKTD